MIENLFCKKVLQFYYRHFLFCSFNGDEMVTFERQQQLALNAHLS